MKAEIIISVVCLTLECTILMITWILGGAERWRRVRWFAVATGAAVLYSAVSLAASWLNSMGPTVGWSLIGNLALATVYAAVWLIFLFIDDRGSWQSVPKWVQYSSTIGVALVLLLILTGIASTRASVEVSSINSLGISVMRARFNAVGEAAVAVPVLLFLAGGVGYMKRFRSGERGSIFALIGFCLFFAFALEEVAVALGWIDFLYLGNLAYLAAITPFATQLLYSLRDDANRLDRLTFHLAEEVRSRTEERDEARRVMLEQQRLAALGRLAAGVGHEVNNPLQYVQLSLEEIRESKILAVDPDLKDALGQALEGVDRIRQVVDGLRTYARPGTTETSIVDLNAVVSAAVRISSPQWRQGVEVETLLADVPPIRGNEGKLVQVVLNPVVNGIQSMLASKDRSRAILTISTGTDTDGWAVVTVCDQGPGFAAGVIGHLGEPYITTKSASGGTGLGLFVTRGIVEAHGGTMRFGNIAEGGASVVMRFPPVEATAS